ncbi:hypothetical protein V6Z11_D08G089200 [Gossypium hirsutum]
MVAITIGAPPKLASTCSKWFYPFPTKASNFVLLRLYSFLQLVLLCFSKTLRRKGSSKVAVILPTK